VILDVDMPILGGPGMAHQMLLHDAGQELIPIILVSAKNNLAAGDRLTRIIHERISARAR
jgi:FixJ family two-component response regulator